MDKAGNRTEPHVAGAPAWARLDHEGQARLDLPSSSPKDRQAVGGRLGIRPARGPAVGRREISEKAGKPLRVFDFL